MVGLLTWPNTSGERTPDHEDIIGGYGLLDCKE